MPKRLCLLLAMAFAFAAAARRAYSQTGQKAAYSDCLYIGNLYRGSQNPASISRDSLEVTEVRASYGFLDGGYKAVDAADIRKAFDFSLYGVRRFGKVAFEGGIAYSNISERGKRWNSTLFVSEENPFVIADSVPANFSVEKFDLNGGFSYRASDILQAGLRARYKVGSAANQTDPRPETDGMRFLLNPGVDCKIGLFTVGLSGEVEWLSESVEYTVVRTIDDTYYVFLFHGLGDPIMKTAIGYQRKYDGLSGGGDLQIAWEPGGRISNLFEAGFRKGDEEAIDGSSDQKFKGGKYNASKYAFTDRFMIKGHKHVQNIILHMEIQQNDGTYYYQEQRTTSDGNIIWDVISSSVCHKDRRVGLSLEYRYDRLSALVPHFTVGAEAGMRSQETTHYPEMYSQEHTDAWGEIYLKKIFPIRKNAFVLSGNATYKQRLSEKDETDGTVLQGKYNAPRFEYLSGSGAGIRLNAEFQHPLSIKDYSSRIGYFVELESRFYTGGYGLYDGASRRSASAGAKLIF